MSASDGDLSAAIRAAAGSAAGVLGVGGVRVGGTDRDTVAGVRVSLNPSLSLAEVLRIVGRVELAVLEVLPAGGAVFIEPDIASDLATPTEAIVIRSTD